MNLKDLLTIDKDILSKSDNLIIDYLFKHKEDILYVTSNDISEKLG